MDKYSDSDNREEQQNYINFFVKLTNIKNFDKDNKQLKSIIKEHVKPTNNDNKIKIIAYFKPTKLSSCFSTRRRMDMLQRSHVVYQFRCPMDSCSASYLGYTTNTLATRAQQHRYKSSKIQTHISTDHSDSPNIPADTFINSFSILYSYNNPTDLKIVEAIAIREQNPFINVKYNEYSNYLNIYK